MPHRLCGGNTKPQSSSLLEKTLHKNFIFHVSYARHRLILNATRALSGHHKTLVKLSFGVKGNGPFYHNYNENYPKYHNSRKWSFLSHNNALTCMYRKHIFVIRFSLTFEKQIIYFLETHVKLGFLKKIYQKH